MVDIQSEWHPSKDSLFSCAKKVFSRVWRREEYPWSHNWFLWHSWTAEVYISANDPHWNGISNVLISAGSGKYCLGEGSRLHKHPSHMPCSLSWHRSVTHLWLKGIPLCIHFKSDRLLDHKSILLSKYLYSSSTDVIHVKCNYKLKLNSWQTAKYPDEIQLWEW